jgi:predicted nucleic acid-binding protein
MLLVDTNVLIDVLQDDSNWADWSIRQLRAQSQLHELAINPIIYAELSLMYESIEALEQTVATMRLSFVQMPRPALFVAAKAFLRYRREGGTKQNVLPDFFIGAHAAVARCALLTRDPARYRAYFPTVELLTPEPGGRS